MADRLKSAAELQAELQIANRRIDMLQRTLIFVLERLAELDGKRNS